jgi:phosphotriesterase-related protein
MNRRDFIKTAAIAGLARPVGILASPVEEEAARQINTVLGPIPAASLGQTLMHEHILTDFIGADRLGPGRYDAQDVIRIALPHLQQAKSLGCETLVECTPAYMGRAPALMAALAKASGLHIVTNTGFYGAAGDRYVPRFAHTQTAEALATLWIREYENGIPPTGIRPGFIKIGTDAGALSDIDAKLVSAAAITHRRTGLAIVSHSGNGVAAMAQLALLKKYGVQPPAFIWAHAQDEKDTTYHRRASDLGAWVEFDGIAPESAALHIDLILGLKKAGHLERTLISEDNGSYHVGEPGGGGFGSYGFLFTGFLPEALKAGLSQDDVNTLMLRNPQRALARQGASAR